MNTASPTPAPAVQWRLRVTPNTDGQIFLQAGEPPAVEWYGYKFTSDPLKVWLFDSRAEADEKAKIVSAAQEEVFGVSYSLESEMAK